MPNGYFVMIREPIHQEDIMLLCIYALNNRASKCVKNKWSELKGEIESLTIIVGYSNTPLF